MNRLIVGFFILIVFSCNTQSHHIYKQDSLANQFHDHHVHVMSPQLISLWKSMGIPFSRPDYFYADIDSILKYNNDEKISLISMGYVYTSQEFGGNSNQDEEKIRDENNYLAEAKSKYPNRIKAYYGIDPLHKSAIEEVIRCHEVLKLDGIKLHHNASQVYLTVPEHLLKVKSIFQYASDNRIPILLHFDNSHPKFGKRDVGILVDSILTNLEYVNLQIAHFGTSGGFNQKTKQVLDSFIELFQSNHPITKHKIHFDISAVCLDKDSEGVPKLLESDFSALAQYCRKLGFDKIIFGTDYPLYSSQEYLDIIKDKLKLTNVEVNQLIKEK